MTNTFSGKTVIITGKIVHAYYSKFSIAYVLTFLGSSSGIGAGVAVEFAKLDSNIVLSGRNVEQLKLVKEQCVKAGLKESQVSRLRIIVWLFYLLCVFKVVFVAGEITDQKCQEDLIEAALKSFQQIDTLVTLRFS